MSIFDRFAEAFPLVSDEDARWAREGVLLTRLAKTAGLGQGRVLDLACGSGFHARHLGKEGFQATGVDHSTSAMRKGQSLPHGECVRWVPGNITEPIDGSYDLVLLVGNTLCLLDKHDAARVFRVAADVLVSSGIFLVHVIDFDYLRLFPVRIKRQGRIGDRSVVFEKQINLAENGALIRITVISDVHGDRVKEDESQWLNEYRGSDILSYAKRVGLEPVGEYGGLDLSPRRPGETKDMVHVFRSP